MISSENKEELHKYITGIVTAKSQKLIAINCMPNHVHMLLGIKPDMAVSNIVRDIKANSSRFINEQKWMAGNFEWQKGFGAFSLGNSQLTAIIRYMANQEQHHYGITFREEYVEFLKRYEVNYNADYIFTE